MKLEVFLVICACASILLMRSSRRSKHPTRIREMLVLMIPRAGGAEMLIVVALAILSVTKIHLLVSAASSRKSIAKFLVVGERKRFIASAVDVALWSAPRAIVDSALKYFATLLAQRMRSHLQNHVHASLQRPHGYVCASAVGALDQRATQDAIHSAYGFVDTFIQVMSPSIDIAFLSKEVLLGAKDFISLFGVSSYFVVALGLQKLVHDPSNLLSSIQGRETDLRTTHSQICSHAEEIAFYRGELIERENCNRRLDALSRKLKDFSRAKLMSDIVESIATKYLSTATGYLICYRPLLNVTAAGDRAGIFSFYQQLYSPLALAVGRVARANARMKRSMMSSMQSASHLLDMRGNPDMDCVVLPWRGSPRLSVDRISIALPKSEGYLENLSFSIIPGDSLLLTCSNGEATSSLISVIAGLSSVIGGDVCVPPPRILVVSPQRVILPLCSLRDLLTYPLDNELRLQEGITDSEIRNAAQMFGLAGLIDAVDLSDIRHWSQVLSGGEGQRVALTRIALQRPTFALLNECTNALTQQDELSFLTLLQNEGITLVTVSHRTSLRSIHSTFINLDDHFRSTE